MNYKSVSTHGSLAGADDHLRPLRVFMAVSTHGSLAGADRYTQRKCRGDPRFNSRNLYEIYAAVLTGSLFLSARTAALFCLCAHLSKTPCLQIREKPFPQRRFSVPPCSAGGSNF